VNTNSALKDSGLSSSLKISKFQIWKIIFPGSRLGTWNTSKVFPE
jgi:hypothetical protein